MNFIFRRGILLLIPVFFIQILQAQRPDRSWRSHGLHIGDQIPGIEFNVSNYKTDKLRLTDLKGKLVILDFWSHMCTVCIQAFAKLDSLQKYFGDRIQIILVSQESEQSNNIFFAKKIKLKRPDLPFITGDTVLLHLFPHSGVPYHVWIDSLGRISYMTEGYNATQDKISEFLNGKSFEANKYGFLKATPSLFDTSRIASLEYFSYISRCIQDIRLSSITKPGYSELVYDCNSIRDLYKTAFGENGKYGIEEPGRIILEVKDSSKYERPTNTDLRLQWQKQYSFNYHLQVPEDKADQKYKLMQEDLSRYFNLSAKIETRHVLSLVLVRTSEKNKLKTGGGNKVTNFYYTAIWSEKSDSLRTMINVAYSYFHSRFKTYIENNFKKPFVDKVNIKENIDICLTGSAIDNKDLFTLRKELRRYDLDLLEKSMPLKVLVIKEKK